jgi:hypothetical protein
LVQYGLLLEVVAEHQLVLLLVLHKAVAAMAVPPMGKVAIPLGAALNLLETEQLFMVTVPAYLQ